MSELFRKSVNTTVILGTAVVDVPLIGRVIFDGFHRGDSLEVLNGVVLSLLVCIFIFVSFLILFGNDNDGDDGHRNLI